MKNERIKKGFLAAAGGYPQWRETKLNSFPQEVDEIRVEIGGLAVLSDSERQAILKSCGRSNMAIYRCRDHSVDRAAVCAFSSRFGLNSIDHHLCANADGVSELTVASEGARAGYVPYSNRSLSWHTDGYYNEKKRQVNAVVLHCAQNAAAGGENELLDPEIAYIRLRDEDPRFITAFEHPECMTIPANEGIEGEIRPAVSGPVFSYDVDGEIHMRYSARKRNISWRDDDLTRAACDCLTGILAEENSSVLRYCLQPGEGLISNNVLHNRTAFTDGPSVQRLLYRARYFDRIADS